MAGPGHKGDGSALALKKREEVGRCRRRFVNFQTQMEIDEAQELMTDHKVSVLDVMGAWFYNETYKCKIYVMEEVERPVKKPEYMERFRMDAAEIRRMRDASIDDIPDLPVNGQLINKIADVRKLVDMWKEKNYSIFSVDCEWKGRQHIDGKLRYFQAAWSATDGAVFQFMNEKGEYVFDAPYEEVGKVLGEVLNLPRTKYVGHHISADFPWMNHVLGLEYYGKCIMDTEFAMQTIDEYEDLGLERIALKFTTLGRYDIPLLLWTKSHTMDRDDGYGFVPDDILYPYAGLRGESKVQLGDGSWQCIRKLVNTRYAGEVRAQVRGNVVLRKVTDWHKTSVKQKAWVRLQTPTSRHNAKGLTGPLLAPNQEVLTQRGKVRVNQIRPGHDRILTAEKALTADQLSIILGSLLGDGGLCQRWAAGVYFRQSQNYRRRKYAAWKASALSPALSCKRVVAQGTQVAYESLSAKCLADVAERFPRHPHDVHAKRKLIVTKEVLDTMGLLGLAVWYQDDGTLTKDHNARIYCTKLTEDEQNVVVEWLRSKFGDGIAYYKKNRNRFISFTVAASERFLDAIHQYMHPSVGYKSVRPVVREYGVAPSQELFYESIQAVVPANKRITHGGGIQVPPYLLMKQRTS